MALQQDYADSPVFAHPPPANLSAQSATEKLQPSFKMDVLGAVISQCVSCHLLAVWIRGELVWPEATRSHWPNQDLPTDARRDFEEADRILAASPRGAAALLRLAIQRLCDTVEPSAKDLNDAIGRMVKRGLRVELQQALDTVRVIGNNAVHPGEINLEDDTATASGLFNLVNLIADAMITQPRKIAEVYGSLPKPALDGIAKRDGTGGGP